MAMLKHLISTLALLASAVWLGFPMLGSSSHSPTGATYDVVAQSSEQGRSFIIRDTTIDPGGSIGWHWHQGTVIALVKQGTCTTCAVTALSTRSIGRVTPSSSRGDQSMCTTGAIMGQRQLCWRSCTSFLPGHRLRKHPTCRSHALALPG